LAHNLEVISSFETNLAINREVLRLLLLKFHNLIEGSSIHNRRVLYKLSIKRINFKIGWKINDFII